MRTKYPKEVFTALTSTQTFSVAANLYKAKVNGEKPEKKGQSPYKIYDENFSKFKVSIIRAKDQEHLITSANIDVDRVPDLAAKTQAALQSEVFYGSPVIHQVFSMLQGIEKIGTGIQKALSLMWKYMLHGKAALQKKPSSSAAEQSLPPNFGEKARTMKFRMGRLKDQTPYDLLAADPKNEAELRSQRSYLAEHLDKYPANQSMIDAIDEALLMLQKCMIGGKNGSSVSSPSSLSFGEVLLYKDVKANPYKKTAEGLCPVTSVEIKWTIGNKYPVSVEIQNADAPLNTAQSGTINYDGSRAVNQRQNIFRLSSEQWSNCIYKMQAHMRRFEILTATSQFKEAEAAEKANREEAEQQKNMQ